MRILIVKLSSLGDVVHAMPAVQDIRRALPDAQIDWVVERSFAPLVRCCEGVRRVIECELRRWRKTPFLPDTRAAWQSFCEVLQRESYDAVIDLQGLTKSALMARMARLAPGGKRYAMANQTEGSGYEAPTRWVADVAIKLPKHIHAVARARELCRASLNLPVPSEVFYGLLAPMESPPPAIDSEASRLETTNSLKAVTIDTGDLPVLARQPPPLSETRVKPRPVVALVHGTSRADKEWPRDHWVALGERLEQAGFAVGLPHGNDAEQWRCEQIATSLHQAQVWPRLGLDALTTQLSGCAGVIGVDSGLSHIAVALDLPHVQIYNFDTAWRTGPPAWVAQPNAQSPLPRQCSVFAQPSPSVAMVWQAWVGLASPLRTGG